MECYICIETVSDNCTFKCNACKSSNCIDCHKKYLLTSTQDPHCINCRAVIPYDLFLQKFGTKWIFDKYKKHRYDVLWEREQSLIPETVQHISIKKQEQAIIAKKKVLYEQLAVLDEEIALLNFNHKNKKITFQYTYACPIDTCKGFLNKDYICEICNSDICSKCYVKIHEAEKGHHECIPELVETFSAIKKEAKPCPTCGEFISKISGCDQMFCVKCATAFSWKTGLVEKGIIHNPHAHAFFNNNPEAQQQYLNNVNNNADGCRPPIPQRVLFKGEYFTTLDIFNILCAMHRNIAEFRQYTRNRIMTFIQDNNNHNLDLRMKYVNNEITEKQLKTTLHARDKKLYFKKNIFQTYIYAYEIAEMILWTIADLMPQPNVKPSTLEILSLYEKTSSNIKLLEQLITDTNKNLRAISEEFKYQTTYTVKENFGYIYLGV